MNGTKDTGSWILGANSEGVKDCIAELREVLRVIKAERDRLSEEVRTLRAELEKAGAVEMRLKKAEEVVRLARELTSYTWQDRLEDCEVSDDAKHDSRELGAAVLLYDQEARP